MSETVFFHTHESLVGPLFLAVREDGAVVGIHFLGSSSLESCLAQLKKSGYDPVPHAAALTEVMRQLDEYFAQERREFDLQLAPKGTDFQQAVWSHLCKIPYGTCISYGQLALALGNPKASRAVGLANGQNPIPIVIPCHRVIGSNGKLTGFGGGLPAKHKLLSLEGYFLVDF